MNGNALHSTLRELRTQFSNPRLLGGMAVVAIILGVSGPFGTFELLAPLSRLIYWTAIVVLTYGAGFASSTYADRRWGRGMPRWARLLVIGTLPAIPTTLIVAGINLLMFGPLAPSVPDLLSLFAYCTLVSLAVMAIAMLIESLTQNPAPAAAVPTPPAILERMPHALRGRLLALSVEDHYVEIITDKGRHLVLMRLADAMREVTDVDGLQIHRSHWIARDAVVKSHRADGRLTLELSNGLRLPVSRGYVAEAKAKGLVA